MIIEEEVSEACKKKILFKDVVTNGEIIEDYSDDQRGHSCLMMGETREQRVVHVLCSPKDEYLAIVTAYIPNLEKWSNDLKTRK